MWNSGILETLTRYNFLTVTINSREYAEKLKMSKVILWKWIFIPSLRLSWENYLSVHGGFWGHTKLINYDKMGFLWTKWPLTIKFISESNDLKISPVIINYQSLKFISFTELDPGRNYIASLERARCAKNCPSVCQSSCTECFQSILLWEMSLGVKMLFITTNLGMLFF